MHFTNLLIIMLVALAAPLIVNALPALRVPSPVLEIVAGIVIGPSVLGLVQVDAPVEVLALVGLAFLLFLAGLEIDAHRLRGRPLTLALIGFVLSFAIAVGVALLDRKEHTSELQSRQYLVCRLLLEKKKQATI